MKKRKAFLLRMRPDLYAEIEAWAQQEMRSVNGQIEFLLTEAVRRRRSREIPPAVEAADAGKQAGLRAESDSRPQHDRSD